ncbi:dolichol-phosphate mannosyltransferase [Rhodobacterales bacterium 52_120_T64]|nr:dolichol-phosphate mannosyltransferase [Rhodobacterales bacterium 52_120_T64]
MKNEADNIEFLVKEIAKVVQEHPELEATMVDDGSSDNTANLALELQKEFPWLHVLQHDKSGGQSAAIDSGIRASKSDIICTVDGDGQNPPSELPKLFLPLLNDSSGKLGLVAGQRVDRQDTLSKKWASRFANAIRKRILRDGTRDTGCGLKAFRRDAYLALPYFNHMHRYFPALFKRDGWEIELVDVKHQERNAGTSNYNNFQRGIVGIYDLIGVAWLIKRRKQVHASEYTVDKD